METFDQLITSEKPVLVDFFATWCGPCKKMHPILEELKKIKGDSIRIAKIDVDIHQELAARYNVQSVPTLIIFKGGILKWRISGVVPLNDLKKKIEEFE